MSDQPELPSSGGARAPEPNRVRFEVAALTTDHPRGFQVLVFVDDVEITALGAGLGMDPYDLLVPRNRLVATGEPRRVPIARCTCGVYGCGETDVLIVRDGDRVRWEWLKQKPMEHGVTFPADDYDAEVERLGNDVGWETPERTAGRLVLRDLDGDLDRLRSLGMEPQWAADDHPRWFRVAFRIAEDYQVFVRFPWKDRTPQQLAAVVSRTLARKPQRWPATWHAIRPELTGPPSVAGRRWRPERW
ncbi:hypothetical protein E1262_24630 [Jiangella aurantiaca]|uniref:Uncharacterized protein n=1 Tax=Jiangella aurantiaca TaxID=2530373 RepID=A0A4R5A1K1_9ACTN|nr:hypothetical protein [Jiangella aurantiaca]TDD65621.1 hypothetical protein E1262_24630 [Jiangella aurantiaca]